MGICPLIHAPKLLLLVENSEGSESSDMKYEQPGQLHLQRGIN